MDTQDRPQRTLLVERPAQVFFALWQLQLESPFDDFTAKEVALRCGVSESTARRHLQSLAWHEDCLVYVSPSNRFMIDRRCLVAAIQLLRFCAEAP